MTFIQHADVS